MKRVDLVRSAFDLDNPNSASYLADNFQWSDSLGSPPMNKSAWLGMGDTMRSAFPDLSYVIEDIREEGDGVAVTGRFAGTFTNDFDLSPAGMGTFRATGARVNFPSSTALVSFEGDKISKIRELGTGPDAGMQGFLKALSVAAGQ
jgi:predicted ester cyclase